MTVGAGQKAWKTRRVNEVRRRWDAISGPSQAAYKANATRLVDRLSPAEWAARYPYGLMGIFIQ